MDIKLVDTKKLNPAPYNPRLDLTPADREWRNIENSLDSFGYLEPIVWNERTGNIVGGHIRYKILKERGTLPKKIECVVVNLSEDDEKACNLALNKATGLWDKERLDSLLQDLETSKFDMDSFGFDHIDEEFFRDPEPVKEQTQSDERWVICPNCKEVFKYES